MRVFCLLFGSRMPVSGMGPCAENGANPGARQPPGATHNSAKSRLERQAGLVCCVLPRFHERGLSLSARKGLSTVSKTDYEQLYHLLNRRRREELQKLEDACRSLADGYAGILQRDSLSQQGLYSRERAMYNDAMVRLSELADTFYETDRQLDRCAATQGEPVIEVLSGGKETNGIKKCSGD